MFGGSGVPRGPSLDRPPGLDARRAFGAALVPVLFAYGGWQTSGFVAGEVRDPERDLPRGLLIGVAGVVVLYLAVNFVCLRVLGPAGSPRPHAGVRRHAARARRARRAADRARDRDLDARLPVQCMLTAPRVYYAMAATACSSESVGRLHPRTRVPVVAIVLQGLVAASSRSPAATSRS